MNRFFSKIKILDSISRTGVRFASNPDEESDIMLSNQISVLLSILPLIYIASNVYSQGWSRITLPILTQPIVFLLPIALNYFSLTTFSRIFLSWSMALQAMAFSIFNKTHSIDYETAHYIGIQFSIMAASVIPFLVFRLKNVFLIVLSLSASFVALGWFDAIHNLFGVGYYQVGLHETGYALTTMRVMIGFILITGSSLFLKKLVEKNEAAKNSLIADLADKNNEIQNNLEEIVSQNEYISSQNIKLEEQKGIIENQNNLLLKDKDQLELRVEEKSKDILQANLELEKQNVQLEQFAFMAAHNLRNPVARIQGLADVLNLSSTTAEEKEHILQLIKKSSNDLDEVIHNLVTVVQARSNVSSDKKRLRIMPVLDEVLYQLRHDIETNHIEIRNELHHDLEFEVNEAFAHSVFLNILSNSIKYKYDQRTPLITIRDERSAAYTMLEISDNGIGFDSDLNKGKIFKPFSRLNTSLPGKGIGLYLVKVQMESMGGQVSVKSKPYEGTTVNLQFPRVN